MIALAGDATVASKDVLKRWTALLPTSGPAVFDLRQVGKIDSNCVATLIAMKRSAQINEIEISFKNPPLGLQRLVEFYKLGDILGFDNNGSN